MHFSKLKELVKKLGGVLVLNGDEPELVILSYSQYEKIEAGEEARFYNGSADNRSADAVTGGYLGSNKNEQVDVEQGDVERLNQEILALKEEIRLKEEAELQGGELAYPEPIEEFGPIENAQSAEPVAAAVDPASFLD